MISVLGPAARAAGRMTRSPGFVAETAGHAAASGIGNLNVKANFFEQFLFAVVAEYRALVAVDLDEGLRLQAGRLVAGLAEEFGERNALSGQPPRVEIVGVEVDQFVAERGQAARLQADHRHARTDRLAQLVHDTAQPPPGGPQHAVVEPGPSAAELAVGDRYPVPGGLQYLGSCYAHLGG